MSRTVTMERIRMNMLTLASGAVVVFLLVMLSIGGCEFLAKSSDNNHANADETKLEYKTAGNLHASTFDGFLKKRIAPSRFAQTTFELSPDQQLLLLNRAFLTKFFQLPSFIRVPGATSADTSLLRIASGSFDHTVKWTADSSELAGSGTTLPTLLHYVDSVVLASKQYRRLPAMTE